MKIVHICWEYIDDYGYQEQLLPKAHARLGHDVVVLTPKKVFAKFAKIKAKYPKGIYEYDKCGVRICRMNYISFFGNRLTIIKDLYKKLEIEKPDIIFVHMIQSLSMLTAVKYKKNNNTIKLFADSHADSYNSANTFITKYLFHKVIWRFIATKSLMYLDKLFYIAPMSKDFLNKMYKIPDSVIAPLYLGADVSKIDFTQKMNIRTRIRNLLNIKNEDLLIISGGKTNKDKKIDVIFNALLKVNSPNVHFLLFGSIEEGYRKSIDIYINSYKNTHIIDWLNNEELYNYLFASDLAIYPGTQSVIWQQTICAGVPIIVKKWPGGEYLDLGGNIKFLDDDDSDKLSSLIRYLLENRNELEKMRIISENRALAKFSYDEIAKQIFNY